MKMHYLFQSLDGLSEEGTGQLGDAGQVVILERSHFPQRTFHRPTEGRILFRALERIVLQTRRAVGTRDEERKAIEEMKRGKRRNEEEVEKKE